MGNKWLFLIFQRDYDYDYLCFQVMSINIKKTAKFLQHLYTVAIVDIFV